MGIQGLIPFLEKSSRVVNISQYAGCTVAIDAYCWLHKGAFSCADKLARGEKSDVYVNYCMKYVNMLLSHNIKPILVFDGRHLPAKAGTEKKRRQNREMNRKRAAELLRQDKPNEARTYLQRCVDVTHMMAVELMHQCRNRNVDCITAPYEADAQLAYLNISNIAHIVITEDSDLLLFGCTKVMFKLDLNGNGLMVEQENLHQSMGVAKGCFSMDKFRHMCILSGCDYLPSLPKIGLAKACRFVKSTVDPDIHRALSRLGGHLNMNITVPVEYRDKFMEADAMFRHQPVFDPLTRRLVPLTPLPPGAPPPPLLAQERLTQDQLLDLALGNLDPFSLTRVENWTPDKALEANKQSNGWNMRAPHKSIWSEDFKPKALVIERPNPCHVKRTPTSGKVIERKVDLPTPPEKRSFSSAQEEIQAIFAQYGSTPEPPSKKPRLDIDDSEDVLELLEKTERTPLKNAVKSDPYSSPQKVVKNPFSKATPESGNKFSGLNKLAQFRRTSISDTNIVQSRFFGNTPNVKKPTKPSHSPEISPNVSLKEISNTPAQEVPVKLSDGGISSLLEDLDKSPVKKTSGSTGKENSSSIELKSPKKFKWKSSLYERFGFKSQIIIPSPTGLTNDLVPRRNDSTGNLTKSGLLDGNVEEKIETPTCRRNPFAKKPKEEVIDYLGSQGSCGTNDSLLDSSNSEGCDELADDPPPLFQSYSSLNSTPRPKLKVGLSKKQNIFQRSLTMYSFKPKAKLQA